MTDINISDERNYIRFLKWAVDGYRKLNLHGLMPTVKTVELEIDDNTNSATLPQDYIEYLKIGICSGGYLINFDLNERICLPTDKPNLCPCEPSEIEQTINEVANGGLTYGVGWEYFNPRYNNAIYTAGEYGVGSGFYGGGYRIDLSNNRIVFDSYVQVDKVKMEYRSTGVSDDGTAIVDDGAIEALTNYVNYQRCLFSKDPTDVRLIQVFKSNFENAAMSYNMRNNARTPDFWVQLMRDGLSQSIKL